MGTSNPRQSTKGTGASLPSPSPWSSSPPDPESIYGIARRHCRERILVEPLRWTNRHLELLRISFEEPSLAPLPSLLEYDGKFAGLVDIQDYYENYHDFSRRLDCVRKLLGGDESPFEVSPLRGLHFLLKQNTAAFVYGEPLYSRDPDDGLKEYPVATYIDREFLEATREVSLHLYSCKLGNLPVEAMIYRKLKRITPANAVKDPYIAALMITTAQDRREFVRNTSPEILPILTVYPSQVLTSLESEECLYLYKADLPSSLLDMFEYPTVAPPISPPVSIQIFTIPFEPALTFRDRLFALMAPSTPDHTNRRRRRRKRKWKW